MKKQQVVANQLCTPCCVCLPKQKTKRRLDVWNVHKIGLKFVAMPWAVRKKHDINPWKSTKSISKIVP